VSAVVDHLVVGAASLAQGVAWCEATLGVTPGPGGRHALMGTHNRLLKIASPNWPEVYLEIIAIDPDGPPPGRARWFGLDDPGLQSRLRSSPQLIHWVARTTTLERDREGLVALGIDPGAAVSASRETPAGTLAWQILVRADGSLACGGALPTLIQWQGRHPAEAMPASGVSLKTLTLGGVPAAVLEVLRLPGVLPAPTPAPALRAVLATARGEVSLEAMA
jgi:hypothetical protein